MPGFVIYRGPSLLDGAPIVAVAITTSGNRKTGNMVQTHILRADVAPIEAIRTGADASICGNCPARGNATGTKAEGRTCYVNVAQGPTVVYKTLQRGGYPAAAAILAAWTPRRTLADVDAWAQAHGLTPTRTGIAHEGVVEGLLAEAAREEAPIIACGTRRLTTVDRICTSSIGSDLARFADRPVLVVPSAD